MSWSKRTLIAVAHHELGHAFLNLYHDISIGIVGILEDTDGKINGCSGYNFKPQTPDDYKKRLDVIVAGFVAEQIRTRPRIAFRDTNLEDWANAREAAERAYPGQKALKLSDRIKEHEEKVCNILTSQKVRKAINKAVRQLLETEPVINRDGMRFWTLDGATVELILRS